MTSSESSQRQLNLQANLYIRIARAGDVHKLEWDGQFTHYRNLFRRAFNEQRRGNRLMLVMDFNNYPVARLFIQFINPNNDDDTGTKRGYMYSFTVMQPFRSLGIGTHMLKTAEAILIKRQFSIATISVGKSNHRAFNLYKARGYQVYGEDEGRWEYRDHEDVVHKINEPSWSLKKTLF